MKNGTNCLGNPTGFRHRVDRHTQSTTRRTTSLGKPEDANSTRIATFEVRHSYLEPPDHRW